MYFELPMAVVALSDNISSLLLMSKLGSLFSGYGEKSRLGANFSSIYTVLNLESITFLLTSPLNMLEVYKSLSYRKCLFLGGSASVDWIPRFMLLLFLYVLIDWYLRTPSSNIVVLA
jgi:hypothetical protein